MAIITKKEIGIENRLPDVVEKIPEKVTQAKSLFDLAWKYSTKIVRFVFVHKSEPTDEEAKEAYLAHNNRVRSSAPSALNQFIK
jgi:hypothetical protein